MPQVLVVYPSHVILSEAQMRGVEGSPQTKYPLFFVF
jgi:hypothetical protein